MSQVAKVMPVHTPVGSWWCVLCRRYFGSWQEWDTHDHIGSSSEGPDSNPQGQ